MKDNQEKKEDKKTEPGAEELKKQLEECRKLKEEYLEGWKRERAGFLNYKKDEIERIEELIKYANEEIILKILPVLDNLGTAEKNIPEGTKKDKCLEGFILIGQQIKSFLKSQGIEEIKTIGEKFDPNFHEAVGEMEVKDKEHGTVVEEVQKGYTLRGKVIRPAKVKISK